MDRVEEYSDGTNVFLKIYIPPCKFVFNGEELVSYGCVFKDRFYVKHLGGETKGKVVIGKEYSIRGNGRELDIALGSRMMPFIKVATHRQDFVILPEINRIYQGKEVKLESMPGGIQVLVRYEEEYVDTVRAYLLMPNGEEYLMYEGGFYTHLFTPYKLYKMRGGNVWIIEFNKKESDYFKKYLCKPPDLNYLFIRSFHDSKGTEVEFSFDMDNWIKVGLCRMIFKCEPELLPKGSYPSLEYCFCVPKESIRVIERKLQKALEEIESNFLKPFNEELKISTLER